MADPPKGWSKAGAARLGRPWRPAGQTTGCYYCGLEGCTECGDPPRMLDEAGLIPHDDGWD